MSDAIRLPKLKAFPGGSLYSLGGPKEPADHSDGHVGMMLVKNPILSVRGRLVGYRGHATIIITRTSNRLNEEMLRKCSNNSEKGDSVS